MRRHRRARLYSFRHQSLGSSFGRPSAITDAGTASTVAGDSTADTLIGAATIVTGSKNPVGAGADCRLNGSTVQPLFSFPEVRLGSVADSTPEDRIRVACATRPSSVRLLSPDLRPQPLMLLLAQHLRLRSR